MTISMHLHAVTLGRKISSIRNAFYIYIYIYNACILQVTEILLCLYNLQKKKECCTISSSALERQSWNRSGIRVEAHLTCFMLSPAYSLRGVPSPHRCTPAKSIQRHKVVLYCVSDCTLQTVVTAHNHITMWDISGLRHASRIPSTSLLFI